MIILGSDHAGYELKLKLIKSLKEKNIEFKDFGCDGEAVDYPDIAEKVCNEVLKNADDRAVLCCGTGIGISMAANKIKGIRAAVCTDYYTAKYTRLHNDANVLCLGGRVVGVGAALEILDVFLKTEFEGGKHSVRVDKINSIENR